jgi:hypothetical protein
MARYTRKVISTGTNAWNAEANDNHLNTFDRPFPIIKHAGDLASLQSAWPAASYDQCLAICQLTATAGDGLIIAISDGTAWNSVGGWQLFNRVVRTAITNTYPVVDADDYIVITGSNTFALTLPAIAGSNKERKITVKHKGTGTVTVTPTGGDTIDTAGTFVMATQFQSYSFTSDGTSDWEIT